eukprot:11730006-Alexandrium_andersonii.AAC.1
MCIRDRFVQAHVCNRAVPSRCFLRCWGDGGLPGPLLFTGCARASPDLPDCRLRHAKGINRGVPGGGSRPTIAG